MAEDLRQRYAEALAAEYTRSVPRCDKWGENEWVENPEPADRVEQTVSVLYEASDGHPAIRFPTCMEVAEVVAAVRDEDLQAWRERAEKAEAAIARVRNLANVYEVNARTIDGVAGRNFFELFTEELRAALDPPRDLPPEETTDVGH